MSRYSTGKVRCLFTLRPDSHDRESDDPVTRRSDIVHTSEHVKRTTGKVKRGQSAHPEGGGVGV
jgi:hypothetical protein